MARGDEPLHCQLAYRRRSNLKQVRALPLRRFGRATAPFALLIFPIYSLFPPGKRRSKLKAADPALFGAMWWPYASLERLCIATYLSIWVSLRRRWCNDHQLILDWKALCLGRR